MNISRAKTILIYAFLGLNIFLCYHLFGDEIRELARTRVSGRQWRCVEEQLAENGYIFEAKAERRARKSSFLTVSPSAVPEKIIRERFAITTSPSVGPDGVFLYEDGKARLRVCQGGLVKLDLLSGISLSDKNSPLDETIAAALVERYLQENGLNTVEICYDYMVHSGKKYFLHYVQTYEGMLLFSGYLKVIMENNKLMGMEMFLLEPEIPQQGREMEVIPVTRALLRLNEVLGPSSPPRRIVKADLGFYSREYDAEKWEVPPVWRFLFDNGESYFINAFTGNLEPEISN